MLTVACFLAGAAVLSFPFLPNNPERLLDTCVINTITVLSTDSYGISPVSFVQVVDFLWILNCSYSFILVQFSYRQAFGFTEDNTK